MTIVSAGILDQRITIQYLSLARGALGGHDEVWNDLATVYAQTIDLSGKEIFQSKAMGSETQVIVTIRWRSDVTNAMRIQTSSGTLMRIANLRRVTRKEFLVLECVLLDG